ncbi:MAG: hypothetical protein FWC39_12055 [Bacteroidetes bacterium]|nr:hypothetical protein [Bacteroidota bacterium]
MRKIIYLFSIIILLISCKKSNDINSSIDDTVIITPIQKSYFSITHDKIFSLNSIPSGAIIDITVYKNNTYIAPNSTQYNSLHIESCDSTIIMPVPYMYNNKFIGLHTGETKIKIYDDKDTTYFNVAVIKSVDHDEPFLVFGANKNAVIEYMQPYLDDDFYYGFKKVEIKDNIDETIDIIRYRKNSVVSYHISNYKKKYFYDTDYYFKDNKLIKVAMDLQNSPHGIPYWNIYYFYQYYKKESQTIYETVSLPTDIKSVFIFRKNNNIEINVRGIKRQPETYEGEPYYCYDAMFYPR